MTAAAARRAAGASPGTSTTTAFGFEAGNDGFTLSGATRVAAPAAGHGGFSLQFGGLNNVAHEASRDIAIPAGVTRADLEFYWYVTTGESPTQAHFDRFYLDVRNTSGTVLSTVDHRSDGWPRAQWLQHANVDLTPWAGQTVRVAFRGTTDLIFPTTFWADDVSLVTYHPGILEGTVTLTAPAGGATLQGTVALAGTATAGVTRVDFLYGLHADRHRHDRAVRNLVEHRRPAQRQLHAECKGL